MLQALELFYWLFLQISHNFEFNLLLFLLVHQILGCTNKSNLTKKIQVVPI